MMAAPAANSTLATTLQTTTNGTGIEGDKYTSLLLLLIPALTIFGNILVCLSILRERSLQTITNYFIFSLAIADFLVALVVMPFAVYVEFVGANWDLGHPMCNVYIACDVTASTASILNLLAISIDRFIAITRPIQYSRHGKNSSRAWVTIGVVWLLSFLIALPIGLGINDEQHEENTCAFNNHVYVIISSIGSFYIPCFLMAILYAIIMKRLRERAKLSLTRRTPRHPRSDRLTTTFTSTLSSGDCDPGVSTVSDIGLINPGRGIAAGMALLGGAKLIRDIGGRLDRLASEDSNIMTGSITSTDEDEDEEEDRHSMLSAGNRSQSKGGSQPPSQHARISVTSSAPQFSRPPGSETCSVESEKNCRHQGFADRTQLNEMSSKAIAQESPLHLQDVGLFEKSEGFDDDEEPLTLTSELRSFGENLAEQIPFIDCSRPGSLREHQGSGQSNPNHVPIVNTQDIIEELPYGLSLAKDNCDCRINGKSAGENHASSSLPLNSDGDETPNRKYRNLFRAKSEVFWKRATFKESFTTFKERFRKLGFSAKVSKIKTRHMVKKEHRHIRKEQKATQTLAVVLVVFLCCWLPFFTCHTVNSVGFLITQQNCISFVVMFFTTWLGYLNSFMNPIIYTIFNPEYRKAFRKILTCSPRNRR